jgi:hypothetical protein
MSWLNKGILINNINQVTDLWKHLVDINKHGCG